MICSMAVALPQYRDLQWHIPVVILGLQKEQIRWPLPHVNICRGGFISSMHTGHSGIMAASGRAEAGLAGTDSVAGIAGEGVDGVDVKEEEKGGKVGKVD